MTSDEPADASTTNHVSRLIGVYNADGTMFGELAYVAGRAIGRAHCALCDITHGALRQRPEWNSCSTSLGVPFNTFHRNDQPDIVRTATGGETPIVVAELTSGEIVALLRGDALDACAKSPQRLIEAVEAALDRSGLQI